MRALGLLLVLSMTGAALAEAPTQSLRPVARSAAVAERVPPSAELLAKVGAGVAPSAPSEAAPETTPEPPVAPVPEASAATSAAPEAAPAAPARPETDHPRGLPAEAMRPETLGVPREVEPKSPSLLALLRPRKRTRNVEDNARRLGASRRGKMICGDPGIEGLAIGRVAAEHAGCGVDEAVRVSAVAGVALSTHAVMDCQTAQTLKAWVEGSARPVIGRRGGGLAGLQVAAHYACRPRNNQSGAKISEHGKGHAIDISGFRLREGQVITVLKGWGDPATAGMLRMLRDSACGPFGTVLGPGSDGFHRDHFHLDTARYRSGSYCR